jgi:hypothetical protein
MDTNKNTNNNTNIDISLVNKHFFTEIERSIENLPNTSQMITKIVTKSFISINEINISNIIKKIKNEAYYYHILDHYELIKIHKDFTVFSDNTDNNNKYISFSYKNTNLTTYDKVLFDFTKISRFMSYNIITFSHILSGLISLNENNICFFDLSFENIVVESNNREKPLLRNFDKSIIISKIASKHNNMEYMKYIEQIIQNTHNYTYKPFEIHLLFYIVNNQLSTISYSIIDEICDTFVENTHILNMFSKQFKDQYKQSCRDFLKQYVNKPLSYIVSVICQYYDKWDVYSISYIYLHIFGSILRCFSLKQTFFNKIVVELSKNIDPNPSKRDSLCELLKKYNEYLDLDYDWSFVKDIPVKKLRDLYIILNT